MNRYVDSARRIVLGVCAVGCLALPSIAGGAITPRLHDAMLAAGPDEPIRVVVVMDEFPDRGQLLAEVDGLPRAARRVHVVSALQRLAGRSQRGVKATVRSLERAPQRELRILWGVNGVALEATPSEIERLAAAPGVHSLLHDHGRPRPGVESGVLVTISPGAGVDPDDRDRRALGPTGGDASGPNPNATVRPDVIAMGAQQVWDQLGYTGNGVIVAVIDTGIDRNHPDLADHIWTNLDEIPANAVDDDLNGYVDDTWGWDFCLDTNDPSDGSHGTQVAGQVAGDGTDGVVTGMAPDAELLALGIDCDIPSRAWEASDYAIAAGAHVITQSYSWWWTDQPDYEMFRRQTDTELAAGVIHVNSAGNAGTLLAERPIPYNISAPAGSPAPWLHPDQTTIGGVSSIIAVGNIDWSTDLIAASSSIGPAAWEDIIANTDPAYPHTVPPEYRDYPYANGAQMGLIKPDVSAYGNGTTTTCPGPFYCGFSGTSSAAPHVSGTVALMLQANPEATPAELAEALMTTAEHRGDPGMNVNYGTGLVQTFDAVQLVESGVVYVSHAFDDTISGNGDLGLDPGETVQLQVTVESRTEVTLQDLEGILSTTTPGVTIHNRRTTFPALAPGGSVVTTSPHFWITLDPAACSTIVQFDLELRYAGSVRRGGFAVRVGDAEPIALLDDDFESNTGWSSDAGTTSRGAWVRDNPEGVLLDGSSTIYANPEDDTTPDPGVTCWVTGNGKLSGSNNQNNNDVDDGTTTLASPVFGVPHLLELDVSYDYHYYDNAGGGDSFKAEVSVDGGMSWATLDHRVTPSNGWQTKSFDLAALIEPSTSMQLRYLVTDGGSDSTVEGAVDEVHVAGVWVNCQDFTPPASQAPNPVGDTLRVDKTSGGHAVVSWLPPSVDAGHDAATLYRVDRAIEAADPFSEAGSSVTTVWYDIDAAGTVTPSFYLVRAENSGGSE